MSYSIIDQSLSLPTLHSGGWHPGGRASGDNSHHDSALCSARYHHQTEYAEASPPQSILLSYWSSSCTGRSSWASPGCTNAYKWLGSTRTNFLTTSSEIWTLPRTFRLLCVHLHKVESLSSEILSWAKATCDTTKWALLVKVTLYFCFKPKPSR